jgi:hypothetical protein
MSAISAPQPVLPLESLNVTSVQSMMVPFPVSNMLIRQERYRNIEVYDTTRNIIGGAYQYGTITHNDFHRYMEIFLIPAIGKPLSFHVTNNTMMDLGPVLPRDNNPIIAPLFLRLGCNGKCI